MPDHTRRSFLTHVGTTASAVGLASVAGCIIFPPDPTGSSGGTTPGGDIPHRQALDQTDADVEVTTADQLESEAGAADGRVIWIPEETTIDLAGRDIQLENVVLASSRAEGSTGAVLTTDDEGTNSPVWDGGTERGLLFLGDNARLTGITVYGPHHSEVDHPRLAGYFPMPDGGRSARDSWREERYARGVTIQGDNASVDNCEIGYFSVQCIAVGSSSGNPPENTLIAHSHLHNALMTSLGYPIDVRTGHPQIHRCYFDGYRHAVNGSGYATAGYFITECTFGPWKISFPVDMHGVHENTSGSGNPDDDNYRDRAGGMMVVDSCRFLGHRIPDLPFINQRAGSDSTHATIRAIPAEGFWFTNNVCSHSGPDSAVAQRNIPNTYSTDENGYHNVYVEGNEWNVHSEEGQQVP